MKKLFTTLLLLFSLTVFGQDYKALFEKEYTTAEDYKAIEADVLKGCNYYLSKSINETDSARYFAMKLAIKWSLGTPDYGFVFDETLTEINKADNVSSLTYMICMCKYVLEHKDKKDDIKEVKYNTVLLFLKYVNNTKNEIPSKGEIKKLQDAQKRNKLKEYLNK